MGGMNEVLPPLILELRRGIIVLSVLSQLEEAQYGYTLVKRMEEKGIRIDTNTLYPLLRRLEKQDILSSEWETEANKPRKYYKRTAFGNRVFEELKNQWKEMNAGIEQLLGGSRDGSDR